MEPGNHKLNPLAPAFYPVSKPEEVLVDKKSQSEKPETEQEQNQPENSSENEDIIPEEVDLELEIDMDIEFLLVTFSRFSHETIYSVYAANNGDLDITIDMLQELEIFNRETENHHIETVNLGHVLEKNAKDEANVTSSAKLDASAKPDASVKPAASESS